VQKGFVPALRPSHPPHSWQVSGSLAISANICWWRCAIVLRHLATRPLGLSQTKIAFSIWDRPHLDDNGASVTLSWASRQSPPRPTAIPTVNRAAWPADPLVLTLIVQRVRSER
jgi:hypothetical protein